MRIRKEQILTFILILSLIAGSADTIWGYHPFIRYTMVSLVFAAEFIIALQRNQRFSRIIILIYSILAVLILLSMTFNMDFSGITMFFYLAVATLTIQAIDFDTFIKQYEFIIFCLCLFSLIGVTLYYLAQPLLFGFPDFENGVIPLKNLFFTVVPMGYTPATFRNFGIFREPGMFAIYIGIALLIQLYTKRPSFFHIILYLVTLITTRSTTGFIAVTVLLVFWTILNTKFCTKIVVIVLSLTGGLAILLYRYDLIQEILIKFNTEGVSSDSINSRLSSIAAGGVIGITHPFWGAGALNSQILYGELAPRFWGGSSWTNMITYLFASFGLFFITLILLGLFKTGLKLSGGQKRTAVCIVVYICLLLCGQIMTYSSIFYILVMYGWQNYFSSRRCV